MHLADMIAKIEELRGNYEDGIEYLTLSALKARLKRHAPIGRVSNDIIYQPICQKTKYLSGQLIGRGLI